MQEIYSQNPFPLSNWDIKTSDDVKLPLPLLPNLSKQIRSFEKQNILTILLAATRNQWTPTTQHTKRHRRLDQCKYFDSVNRNNIKEVCLMKKKRLNDRINCAFSSENSNGNKTSILIKNT